jgi:hypothetical protein
MGRRSIASIVALVVFISAVPLSAVDGNKAEYVGGTITGLPEKTSGRFDTTQEGALVFMPEKKGTSSVSIPYAAITEMEYGQKAGRRVGVAVMISPLALFSKKRKHYLSISYKDDGGKEQAAVFELGKDIVRTTLKIAEVRTGKEVVLQDKEACRQFKTPKECEGR